ncbi:LysR substrate-binding domain-containing protein [Parapusillimonas granuli]|nr:LysR substrate-binding domain-containing protein [Parapusillimonas granuli]MBB5213877.1 DNA-binding transcriptional LysR family regulator [Parapusillimonas granuli]MEB2398956.1 LysR substrate-binding domain-containing protein [Alcaligenaceae bacterium]
MNKQLNYRQTEILWAIVMAGSISGAARLLNISQPAVSRMLGQIEKQLSTRLFERIRGKLQPTQDVRSLFEEIERAQRVMGRINDIADTLADRSGGGLNLGSIPSLVHQFLPRVMADFQRLRPNVLMRIHSDIVHKLVSAVLQGEVEVGFIVLLTEHPYLTVLPLMEGRMVAAVPAGHALAAKRQTTLAELAEHPQIVTGTRMPYGMLALSAMDSQGLQYRISADVPWSQQACALVNADMGVALIDEFTAAQNIWPNVRIVPLKERIPLQVNIIHARERKLSEAADTFIQLARSRASETAAARPQA